MKNIKHGYSKRNTIDGKRQPSRTEFIIWMGIKRRCYNPNEKSYPNYGGRGIEMCEEWKNDFLCFLNDMGERPSSSHSIDRINNEGNYSKVNCKWSTRIEQNNNRRTNVILTLNGVTKTAPQWAEHLGISSKNICKRKRKGWSDEKCLDTKRYVNQFG